MPSEKFILLEKNIPFQYVDVDKEYVISFSPITDGEGTYIEEIKGEFASEGIYKLRERSDGVYLIKESFIEYKIVGYAHSEGIIEEFSLEHSKDKYFKLKRKTS